VSIGDRITLLNNKANQLEASCKGLPGTDLLVAHHRAEAEKLRKERDDGLSDVQRGLRGKRHVEDCEAFINKKESRITDLKAKRDALTKEIEEAEAAKAAKEAELAEAQARLRADKPSTAAASPLDGFLLLVEKVGKALKGDDLPEHLKGLQTFAEGYAKAGGREAFTQAIKQAAPEAVAAFGAEAADAAEKAAQADADDDVEIGDAEDSGGLSDEKLAKFEEAFNSGSAEGKQAGLDLIAAVRQSPGVRAIQKGKKKKSG